MNVFFLKIVNMSISTSWLILAVLILRQILKKAPKWVNILLWGIVAARLLCPFSIESALSLIPSTETIPTNIEMDTTPAIDSGIKAIIRIWSTLFLMSRHIFTAVTIGGSPLVFSCWLSTGLIL